MEQPRVLILEDDPVRIKKFKSIMLGINAKADFTETASDAINKLKQEEYDLILLDHDLGGEIYVATENENTGSAVARWISENPFTYKYPIVIVHSLNPAGAEYMVSLIPHSVRIPFIWEAEKFHNTIKITPIQED